MNGRLSFVAPGFLNRARVLLMALAAVGACGDDNFTEERRNPNAPGSVITDGGAADVEGTLCPESEPKVGENCPSDEESQLRCTYKVGVCTFAGSSYDITLDYCCQRGVNWDPCGTNSTPCDQQPDASTASTPVPDAAAGQ
jgi:hypothetical protein